MYNLALVVASFVQSVPWSALNENAVFLIGQNKLLSSLVHKIDGTL